MVFDAEVTSMLSTLPVKCFNKKLYSVIGLVTSMGWKIAANEKAPCLMVNNKSSMAKNKTAHIKNMTSH